MCPSQMYPPLAPVLNSIKHFSLSHPTTPACAICASEHMSQPELLPDSPSSSGLLRQGWGGGAKSFFQLTLGPYLCCFWQVPEIEAEGLHPRGCVLSRKSLSPPFLICDL